MAGYFQKNEAGTKIRPGAYFNVDKVGEDDSFGAVDGVVAVVFKANFGPVNTVTILDRGDDYESIFGNGLTTDAIREAWYGGAKKILACRLGGSIPYSRNRIRKDYSKACRRNAIYRYSQKPSD